MEKVAGLSFPICYHMGLNRHPQDPFDSKCPL